jgi:hypothetical protein
MFINKGNFLKKTLILVIGLPRNGSAKTNPCFFETQAWVQAAGEDPTWVLHRELVLGQNLTIPTKLKFFE